MTTVVMLLACFSSVVVRADGPSLNENSVARMAKAMARQNEELAYHRKINAALTAALEESDVSGAPVPFSAAALLRTPPPSPPTSGQAKRRAKDLARRARRDLSRGPLEG